jgi:SAM-dependent methyltransferase
LKSGPILRRLALRVSGSAARSGGGSAEWKNIPIPLRVRTASVLAKIRGLGDEYVLGHSERELRRLATQAELVDPITRSFFAEAGIAPGMRVLDVGTGAGDVAFLAAELVGDEGTVVGVDRAEAALARARERAEARGAGNVSFELGDPVELSLGAFDAVIGRYVLQFQGEPGAMLRGLAEKLRPGGVVVFHELDWTGFRSYPRVEAWDHLCERIVEAVGNQVTSTRAGVELPSLFAQAGLPPPETRLVALTGSGTTGAPLVRRIVDIALTAVPSLDEPGADALARQIVDESAERGSLLIGPFELAAWAYMPIA